MSATTERAAGPGPTSALRRLVRRFVAWPRAIAGVAAVEFALILPVMVTTYFGLCEVTLAVIVDRKVGLLARSLADLSSRATTMTTTSLDNIFDAAVMVMRPYDSNAIEMVVTSVAVTNVGNVYVGTVDWSCGRHIPAQNGGETLAAYNLRTANDVKPRPTGSAYAVPAGFQTPTTQSFILVEVQMPYQPTLGRYIVSTKRLNEVTPWPVRNGGKVAMSGACPSG